MKPARNCIPRWGQEVSSPHQPPGAPPPYIPMRALCSHRGRPLSHSHVACLPGPLGPCGPRRTSGALLRCSLVRAWLRWGAPITEVCESDRGLVNFIGICQRCVAGGEASLVQMQHQVSLVAMQLCGPRLVADVARLAGAHLQLAQRSAARWPHPEPRYQPAEEPARRFDSVPSMPS